MKKVSPFLIWFSILVLIMLAGVLGFMILEHYTFIDALYMTVITIGTIGYSEVKPLSETGKIFNIIFIISSFAIFTYALSSLTKYIVSGEMALYFKNRKLMSAIDKFSNHVIICGFGRHGEQAANMLMINNIDFVVIDNVEEHIKNWLEEDKPLVYIHGDATDDEILIKAGIKKAKALLLTLPADADNVFIVLSARPINPKLTIISRAQHKSTVIKLKTAGADHVILPEMIGGSHMATLILKPDVIEFINNLWGDEVESINIESVAYEELPAGLRDKSVYDIINWRLSGVNCLGIKNEDGKFIINPPKETNIHAGMKIILFGTRQQIATMKINFDKKI
ncbi:MAG TPA: potassium channel protein [Ginsengibacter sp.]|nr:potassium channel protein [Ginsengibacter sp.]